MSISAILAFIFLLPGYISYLVVRQYTVGFGRKSGTFDKTLISLLFDIPIFLITITAFNNNHFIKIFNLKKYNFTGFRTFDQFSSLVDNNINIVILLFIVSLIVSVMIGIFWTLILKMPAYLRKVWFKILGMISDKNRSVNTITRYHTVWKQDFVKPSELIPAKIYELSSGKAIGEGFIEEVSSSLENDLEIKVSEQDTFKTLKEMNIFNKIEFTYINKTKDLKIIVYNQDKYLRFAKSNEKEDEK